MESALKKIELERQGEIPVVGDSAGIQERCMQDGDENLKPHLCTVNYTVAEQGLAQYSRTSASPKRQFGCAHLVLERLITRTWPGCASWLPDLGMKFPAKREPKSQDCGSSPSWSSCTLLFRSTCPPLRAPLRLHSCGGQGCFGFF